MKDVEEMISAMVNQAAHLGVRVNIAIVDEAGHLKAFYRMDGAWLGSIDVAIKKARTAALFLMSTADLGDANLHDIENTNGGLITFPGGVLCEGGAIGVSGGTVIEDEVVANAGR